MRDPLDVLDALCASLETGKVETSVIPASAPGRDATWTGATASRAAAAVVPDEIPQWGEVENDPLEALYALCTLLATKRVSFPGTLVVVPGQDSSQTIEESGISRISQPSRYGGTEVVPNRRPDTGDARSRASESRMRGLLQVPGNPGNPGNLMGSPLRSTPDDLPTDLVQPGRPGTDEEQPARTLPTSAGGNSGPSAPPAEPRLAISADDVRAGIDREERALAACGRTGPDALRDALVIVRAKIRNAAVLVERQAMSSRCHVCGGRLDGEQPDVSVLQPRPGQPLHMHAGACHDAYRHRRTTVIDGIMAAAGYPASSL